jgi:hypothetical protein
MLKWIALALALWASPALAQPVFPLTQASVPITVSTQTTQQLVAAPTQSNQAIVVTAVDIIAAGTTNVQFVYGTGTNCGTGQGNVTGNYNLTAQVGFTKGDGNGVLWVLPKNTALCVVNSQATAIPGSVSYAVF